MYSTDDFAKAWDCTLGCAGKRLRGQTSIVPKLTPIKIINKTKYYSDEDFEKWSKIKKCEKPTGKKKVKKVQIEVESDVMNEEFLENSLHYRISVFDAEKNRFFVKHAGLNLKRCLEFVETYLSVGDRILISSH